MLVSGYSLKSPDLSVLAKDLLEAKQTSWKWFSIIGKRLQGIQHPTGLPGARKGAPFTEHLPWDGLKVGDIAIPILLVRKKDQRGFEMIC